ncbi:MAG: Eco57I restriction-modification methylase domain-containing protein [Frankiaceae bacterium]
MVDDLLAAQTEARRVARSQQLDAADRIRLGQFFTPAAAAHLIASMPSLPISGELRVLDPGAGVGSLTAAVVARATPDLKLHVTVIEIDKGIGTDLGTTLDDCASAHPLRYELVIGDFIAWAGERLREQGERFDLIVINPPYRKINAASPERKALEAAGVKTTNLYTGFVLLAMRLLAPAGQLVAITPRSFTNGTYFRKFRHELLSTGALGAFMSSTPAIVCSQMPRCCRRM